MEKKTWQYNYLYRQAFSIGSTPVAGGMKPAAGIEIMNILSECLNKYLYSSIKNS